MKNKYNKAWSIWIDTEKKIVTLKETASSKEVYFENQETGMQKLNELIASGYKIG